MQSLKRKEKRRFQFYTFFFCSFVALNVSASNLKINKTFLLLLLLLFVVVVIFQVFLFSSNQTETQK